MGSLGLRDCIDFLESIDGQLFRYAFTLLAIQFLKIVLGIQEQGIVGLLILLDSPIISDVF